MKTPLPNYTGNKAIPGLFQSIVNQIPQVDEFIEVFAGSAVLSYFLSPVVHTVINDCDRSVIAAHYRQLQRNSTLLQLDFRDILQPFTTVQARESFLFIDPPYLFSSRHCNAKLYQHELTVHDHVELLEMAYCCTVPTMITHPRHRIYDEFLHGWRRIDNTVSYRGSLTVESLYMNYPVPDRLLFPDYYGSDSWDRQRNQRQIKNFISKFRNAPGPVQQQMYSGVTAEFNRHRVQK